MRPKSDEIARYEERRASRAKRRPPVDTWRRYVTITRIPPSVRGGITPNARLVLYRLFGYARTNHEAHPSVTTLADELGLDRKTVRAALAELCEADHISVIDKIRVSGGVLNAYRIHPHESTPAGEPQVGSHSPPSPAAPPAKSGAQVGKSGVPRWGNRGCLGGESAPTILEPGKRTREEREITAPSARALSERRNSKADGGGANPATDRAREAGPTPPSFEIPDPEEREKKNGELKGTAPNPPDEMAQRILAVANTTTRTS